MFEGTNIYLRSEWHKRRAWRAEFSNFRGFEINLYANPFEECNCCLEATVNYECTNKSFNHISNGFLIQPIMVFIAFNFRIWTIFCTIFRRRMNTCFCFLGTYNWRRTSKCKELGGFKRPIAYISLKLDVYNFLWVNWNCL